MFRELLICCLILVGTALPIEETSDGDKPILTFDLDKTIETMWNDFKNEYGKSYGETEEEEFRKEVFRENVKKIQIHNFLYLKGQKTYTMAVNEYADWEHHEFISSMNGYKQSTNTTSAGSHFLPSLTPIELPKTVNWTKKGYVTPVKNQKACGSCWAFSATGSLEGQHYRKTKKLVSLSEQQLVDCSGKFGDEGCNGGLMDYAFAYIKENNGLDTEDSYPYTAQDGKCNFQPNDVGATDTGFQDIEKGNEDALKEAVATIGPISVAIDAAHESFQFYAAGVYNEPKCSSTELDHGVLAVGYGTSATGLDYWLIKNSWGLSWGNLGYIQMSRNLKNQCGIATAASYPLV